MSQFFLPPTLSDELQAVNALLASIAEAPVAVLDTNDSLDVQTARATLNEVDLAVQTGGWTWNREEGMLLSPNVNGNVLLPANTLEVERAYYSGGERPRVGQRGDKLYDRDNHTYSFAQPITCDLIVRLDFGEMPEAARQYITIRAAKLYQGRIQTNSLVDRITEDEVIARLLVLENAESRVERLNLFTDNPVISARLYGRARHRVV